MTKSQLVQKLADAADISKKQADILLQALVDLTVSSVKKGDPVKIPGLGIFRKVQTKARMGRNPRQARPSRSRPRRRSASRWRRPSKTRFSAPRSSVIQRPARRAGRWASPRNTAAMGPCAAGVRVGDP